MSRCYSKTQQNTNWYLGKQESSYFSLLPREASKRVPIFDRGTGSKPERPSSGSPGLQADLSLIV